MIPPDFLQLTKRSPLNLQKVLNPTMPHSPSNGKLPVMIIEIAEIFGKSPSKASLSGLKNIPPLIKQKYETILQTTKYRISKQKSLNNIIA